MEDQIKMTSEEKVSVTRILQDAKLYSDQDSLISEQEMQHYNDTYRTAEYKDGEYAGFRSKMKQMMLVDNYNVNKVATVYKDIYDEAIQERHVLREQASASGIKKVMSDITGSKKKAAQARLAEIEEKKKKLNAARSERSRRYRSVRKDEMTLPEYKTEEAKINQKYQELKDRAARLKQEGEKRDLTFEEQKFLRYMLKAADDIYSKQDVIDACSEYTDKLFQQTTAFLKDHKYDADSTYRDVARWTSPLKQADKASMEQMEKGANAIYVISHQGKRLDGTQESEEDKKADLKIVVDAVQLCYDEMKKTVKDNPDVFGGNPGPTALIRCYHDLNELYKKSQPIAYITRSVIDSDLFQTFTKKEQEHFLEMRKYTSIVSQYCSQMFSLGRKWGEYATQQFPEELKEEKKPGAFESLDFFLENATSYERQKE